MEIERLQHRFEEIYGGGGQIRFFFSPGRANLIGEHIDYYGGHALPFALTQGIYSAVRLRSDQTVQVSSENIEANRVRGFRLDAEPPVRGIGGCLGHLRCVVQAFQDRGCHLHSGMDILYAGDLPIGGGLASSSAFDILTSVMISDLFGFHDRGGRSDAVRISQEAELLRGGTDCDLVDPSACILGRQGHAIFLSAPSLQYEYVPLRLKDTRLIITNTMVQHPGKWDHYLTRRTECEKALKKLKVVSNINQLCDLSIDTFNNCKDVIMNETYMKRARHVVSENARTIRAVSALRVGNLRRFGELMNQSHDSLRDDYEVSCPELDALVCQAREVPGVLGSRMMGGGFGGCTISLVESAAADAYMEKLSESYQKQFGIAPEFYFAEAGDGARELK